MIGAKLVLARCLRWIVRNVSYKWGMRLVRRIPRRLWSTYDEIEYQGIWLRVYTGEEVGFRLYFLGQYERLQEQAYLSLIRRGDLVFDIGANQGIYSALAALQGASVVSFEPSQKLLEMLSYNLIANQLSDRVIIVNAAISHETRVIDFYETREGNWGVGRIFAFGHNTYANASVKYDVQAYTIDEMVVKYGMPKLIKMDIEGAEWLALQGASTVLQAECQITP